MKSKVTISEGFEDRVTGNELKYLIKLGRFLSNKEKTGWPSTNTLAGLTRLSVKTVYNITKSLEKKEIIEVRRRKLSGKNEVNKYRLIAKGINFSVDGIGREFIEEEGGVKITDGGGVKITDELSTSKEVHVQSLLKEEFESLWTVYGKKKARAKSFAAYKNLTKKERAACRAAIPAYVKSTPDVQYRALLTTYIHGKRWEDELDEPAGDKTYDAELNTEWESSYKRFTAALADRMADRAKMVSPLTRSEFHAWFTHARRPLTGRLSRSNLAETLLRWIGNNPINTYKLQKELKTADALLFHAYTGFLKDTGRWGEYSESVEA